MSQRGSLWPDACATAIRNLRLHLLNESVNPLPGNLTQEKQPNITLNNNTPRNVLTPSINRTPSRPPCPPSATTSTSHSSQSILFQTPAIREHHTYRNAVQTNSTLSPSSQASVAVNWPASTEFTSQVGSLPATSGGVLSAGRTESNSVPPNTTPGPVSWIDYMTSNNGITEIIPLPSNDGADPFAGFDIPFWLGQDQYSGMVNDWS